MPVTTNPGAAATVAAPGGGTTGHSKRSWLAAAALILGLALGVAAGLVIPRFTHPGTDSVEAGFLRDMSTHHAQAVEMSMLAHANSANPRIVTLAGDIALTQHGQIGYMQAWLRDWDLSPTGTEAPMAWMPNSAGSIVNGLMPGMATPEQLDSLRKASGNALDIQFLTLMRAHHLGGIHMAQEALNLSDDKNIDWLAQTMVSGQQSELGLIDTLLKEIPPA
ncbi:DUF305 domain-containing protein [Paractinoplanes maris]|uniref:DUF305 domain-containing protein n=1 Tax=Paractinoplanes maris TaxID=1734446 RepID=UPI002021BDD0|nr:DUF305 domain-containing protein [Actinoplanes maris]